MNKHKLPDGWQEVELGDEKYFEILSSGIDKFEGEKDYLSTESIQGTDIEKVEARITYENRHSRANMQPVLNSVWFAKMKATLKVYCFDEENKSEIRRYILSTGFCGIKVNEKAVYPRYLKIFLTSSLFNDEKNKLSTGSTQMGINNSFAARIKISLPPLATQKRIVQVLEKAEQAKRKREEADKLTNDYLKSVFYEMFGEKFEEVELDKLCIKITDGIHNTPKLEDHGIPMLDSKDIDDNFNIDDRNSIKFISKDTDLELSKRCKPSERDILVSSRGSIGKIAIVKRNQNFNIMGNIILVRADPQKLDFRFIANYFYLFNHKLTKQSRGVAQQGLYLSSVRSLKIPLPPLLLQQKFAKIVEHVEKLKEKQQKSKEKIDEMFNVLMQRAFKGELVR